MGGVNDRSPMSYADRLAAAREAVKVLRDEVTPHLSPAMADQMHAAARDVHSMFHALEAGVRAVQPGRDWQASVTPPGDPHQLEVLARTLAALGGFRQCPHLKATPAQPSVARMALRRLDCQRCIRTVVKPPAGRDRMCDWCATDGTTVFQPISYTAGSILVVGDACPDCAAVLQPDQKATP
jgi:hypothetical protein